MEINRTITSVWTITIKEEEVFNRFIDEGIQEGQRRSAANAPALVPSDDDRATLHRYYREGLAELSALLARRTTKVGGSISNTTDDSTKMLTTVFSLGMTCNHESALLSPLASHCLEFLIARLMEKWYGHGSDFGSKYEKDEIRHIIHFRRNPIERPWGGL